jgi:large conductance mechanosensitive channel
MLGNLLKEFKNFAFRGNVVDLAIAVVLGVAFGAVVNSFVTNILMPIVATIVGEPSFDELTMDIGDSYLFYGSFLTVLVNFMLVAFALFLVVKAITRVTRPVGAPEEAPALRACPYCQSNIPSTATRCSACTSEVTPV